MPKQENNKACIIGGSIAGLTAGLALLQRGWDVNVFESTHGNLQSRGAGIITHSSLFDTLETLGVAKQADLGVSIFKRRAFAKDGNILDEIDFPQVASSWGRLYQLLHNRFPSQRYHPNKLFSNFDQNANSVTAHFTDGSAVTSDLLIAADGIRSTVRQKLEPHTKPLYAGYIAWRGLINETELTSAELTEIFPYFTFCLPDGEQVLSYPIAGESHKILTGERRCNVVWYRPASPESTLKELLTDINGNNNGESIAPDKVRPMMVEKMRQDATQLLSPQHAKLIHRLQQPFIQPIYDLTTESMVYGRIAIIGDAAFTARPHLGAGITKAAADSVALAEAVTSEDTIPVALQLFAQERQIQNREYVQRSRELGAYLQAQLMSDAERTYAENHRTTNAVMRETASLQI